jgi:hypothetical protein
MKKYVFPIVVSLLFIAMFFPVTVEVTIEKDAIESNKAFGGRINDEVVGTSLCCKYWLEKDSMPDVATYKITKPLGLSYLFGEVYNVE